MYKFSCYLSFLTFSNLTLLLIFPFIMSLINSNGKIILFSHQSIDKYIIIRFELLIVYVISYYFYKKYKAYENNYYYKFIKYGSIIKRCISNLLLAILLPIMIFNKSIFMYEKVLTKINLFNILYETIITYDYRMNIFYAVIDIIDMIVMCITLYHIKINFNKKIK